MKHYHLAMLTLIAAATANGQTTKLVDPSTDRSLVQPKDIGELPKVVGALVVRLIDQVEVPALETGPLKTVEVTLGDRVKKGQRIARVDDRQAQSMRQLSATELEISRNKSLKFRGDEIAKTDLLEKRSALEQQHSIAKIAKEKSTNSVRVSAAEKAEAAARNEWKRAATARSAFIDSVSESEIEGLRLNYERARLERVQAAFELRMDQISSDVEQAALASAELAVDRAQIQHAVAESERDVLDLDVNTKEQSLALHELQVSQYQVYSPIDGVVVEVYRRGGEWVRPGDPVAKIVNTDQLYAEGFLTGDVLPERGTEVRLKKGDETVDGKVEFVSPERDRVSGEVRFLVRFEGGKFLPGERVEIQW